jgi:hypothetical protein
MTLVRAANLLRDTLQSKKRDRSKPRDLEAARGVVRRRDADGETGIGEGMAETEGIQDDRVRIEEGRGGDGRGSGGMTKT